MSQGFFIMLKHSLQKEVAMIPCDMEEVGCTLEQNSVLNNPSPTLLCLLHLLFFSPNL